MQPSNHQALVNFFRKGRACNYKKGEIIVRAAEVPQGAYLLEAGYVKVYSLTDRGEENLHIIYKQGEIFPLAWIVQDKLRNVFYEAINDVILWLIPRSDVVKAAETDPDFSYELRTQA